MCFCAARVIRNEPRRCTPITVSQSVSVILNSRLSRVTPALLTSTVGGAELGGHPLRRRPRPARRRPRRRRRPAPGRRRPRSASTVPCAAPSSRSSTATAKPVGGQPQRGGRPDPAGRPGDDGHPLRALGPGHRDSSTARRRGTAAAPCRRTYRSPTSPDHATGGRPR